ncbi:hypothetical protein CFIMG_004274RA [Ceratocystis fimbriata CBS 114723]|uniref:Uncharacterized protein n=1 Tax=Ceratocystis fimbriata CBS 114723 TaxID=1035309 RepID=A0A2C5WXF0_9PEZI|nr:hypothetical protein CFIMG_004274RA [Ceratocystis fimbriata CBS 114723]
MQMGRLLFCRRSGSTPQTQHPIAAKPAPGHPLAPMDKRAQLFRVTWWFSFQSYFTALLHSILKLPASRTYARHACCVWPSICPVLSCPVLSCPVLSCPVLSCPVLSCPVLSTG